MNRFKNTIVLFLLFLSCCSEYSISQSDLYVHYGVKDGLPSSEVYSAFQDSKGYMWFATDAGVCRFNGYEFETFDASDGLTDNTVFLITEDAKGRIWFGTFNLQLCYLENGRIYPYKYNQKIASGVKPRTLVRSLAIDSDDNVWIGTGLEGVYKCDKNGIVTQLVKSTECTELNVIDVEGKLVYGGILKEQSPREEDEYRKPLDTIGLKIMSSEGQRNGSMMRSGIISYENINSIVTFTASFSKSKIAVVYRGSIFWLDRHSSRIIDESHNTSFLEGFYFWSSVNDDESIWLCTENEGVFKCTLRDGTLKIQQNYLPGMSVSRIFRDRTGGCWFLTLKNGVYYLPSDKIRLEQHKRDVTVFDIDPASGTLYLVMSNGEVLKRTATSVGVHNETIARFSQPPYMLKYDHVLGRLLIGGVDQGIRFYQNGAWNKLEGIPFIGTKTSLIDSTTIYRGNGYGLSIINNDREVYYSYDPAKPMNEMWCSSLMKHSGSIWIGTRKGIRVYQNGEVKAPFKGNKYLSSSITSLASLNQDIVLVGTKNYGLLVLKNGKIVETFTRKNGMPGNAIMKVHVDDQKNVWVITKKGLAQINFREKRRRQVRNFTSKCGMASIEIFDIRSFGNWIYLNTSEGLVSFDKTAFTENVTPSPVHITRFEVNSEARDWKDGMVFSHDENFIKIHFVGLNYKNPGKVEYRYRMIGVDSNWVDTKERMVQYPTLPPGNYRFELKVMSEDGYWSQPKIISFSVRPPFWLTWWFITLEIVGGIALISGIFLFRERQIRRKSVIYKKMVDLEMKALRSQMNPHFIFNALNSIQHYIAENDFRSTNKYIVQFATLIRMILQLSEKNSITIREEIDILTMYMDLEKVRFEEQFEYTIEMSDEIDPDYDEIPSMMLQPYVENAIWHGLMNKKEKGLIKIGLRKERDYLLCSIEDNGIGRKAAEAIKANRNIQQKSVGMSVTRERLDLINDDKANVELTDLYDEEGHPAGTKVFIKIGYKN